MKPVVVLLFLIFSVLLGSSSTSYASVQYIKSDCIQKKQDNPTNHSVYTQPELSFFKTNHPGLKDADSLILTIEDEDEEDDFVKKHLSPAHIFLAFTYAFILSDRSEDLTETLSCTRDLSHTSSCKYIFQRVLRI